MTSKNKGNFPKSRKSLFVRVGAGGRRVAAYNINFSFSSIFHMVSKSGGQVLDNSIFVCKLKIKCRGDHVFTCLYLSFRLIMCFKHLQLKKINKPSLKNMKQFKIRSRIIILTVHILVCTCNYIKYRPSDLLAYITYNRYVL